MEATRVTKPVRKKMDKQGKEYPIYLQQLTPTTSKKVTMIELSGD